MHLRFLMGKIAALCVIVGLFWIGQGLGLITWPQSSFMIGSSTWIWWGALLAIAGALMMWLSRR